MKNNSHKKTYFIKSISTFLVIVVLILSPSGNVYAQKKEKLLGEKQFDVEMTEQVKKKDNAPVKDQILFRGDKLSSGFMMNKFVFTASTYTASVDSTSGTPIITFVSDSKNADGDKLKWNGTVTAETIEGTAVITDKKGKTKADFAFKGQMKKFRK